MERRVIKLTQTGAMQYLSDVMNKYIHDGDGSVYFCSDTIQLAKLGYDFKWLARVELYDPEGTYDGVDFASDGYSVTMYLWGTHTVEELDQEFGSRYFGTQQFVEEAIAAGGGWIYLNLPDPDGWREELIEII